MGTRARYKRGAVFAAGIQLVLSFALSLNLVVCSSATGHVAVESAFDDCCSGHAVSDSIGSRAHSQEDCGGCTDRPLVETLLQRETRCDRSPLAPPQLMAPSMGATEFQSASPAIYTVGLRQRATSQSGELTARRSIVLLV